MRKILHLKNYDQIDNFIRQVQKSNTAESRFDLYWNRDLGWLWTTADAVLFKQVVEIFKERNWPEILPVAPEPADTPKIITLN
jgi:hypothetical protein